jgi:hypothetical protein
LTKLPKVVQLYRGIHTLTGRAKERSTLATPTLQDHGAQSCSDLLGSCPSAQWAMGFNCRSSPTLRSEEWVLQAGIHPMAGPPTLWAEWPAHILPTLKRLAEERTIDIGDAHSSGSWSAVICSDLFGSCLSAQWAMGFNCRSSPTLRSEEWVLQAGIAHPMAGPPTLQDHGAQPCSDLLGSCPSAQWAMGFTLPVFTHSSARRVGTPGRHCSNPMAGPPTLRAEGPLPSC